MALGGTFGLILWFVVITGIPPAHGASPLYLPLILKLHHDDVPSPPTVPTPPPAARFTAKSPGPIMGIRGFPGNGKQNSPIGT